MATGKSKISGAGRYLQDHALTMKLGRLLICGLVFWMPWSVYAGMTGMPELELIAESRIPVDASGDSYQFVPAEKLVQGQEVFYTLRIHNSTDRPLTEVRVVEAVPSNTRYVAGSASGAGALVSLSYDGGQSFVSASGQNAGGDISCTHIRWELPYPLAPRAVVLARFRVVFQ